ncbi:adenylate kinase 7-like [Schistocerca gregaria]|uniref:adenylate kinase 7-like n=1 Tax=Schistocerca gregaria TaxID=7010 RepID=UPI00211F1545|nr:adenylate kinase 7-like [Schistocerca gregaria]
MVSQKPLCFNSSYLRNFPVVEAPNVWYSLFALKHVCSYVAYIEYVCSIVVQVDVSLSLLQFPRSVIMEEEKLDESSVFSSSEDYSLDSPLEPSPKHLNLDELFGFSAARRKLEEKKRLVPEEPKFFPHRAFINNVDIFNAKYISAHLASQIVGGTKAQDEEEEEEEEPEAEEDELGLEESDENAAKKEKVKPEPSYYEVVATLKYKDHTPPEEVKEIIKEAPMSPQFLEKVMKCGFIIYDISVDSSQISDAMWTLKAIEKELEAFHEKTPLAFSSMQDIRHFILLSTVMTWALTKPVDPVPSLFFCQLNDKLTNQVAL